MAAAELPDVLVIASMLASLTEKKTSMVETSLTVVRAVDALARVPTLYGREPTTPDAGAFMVHHDNCSCAEASDA